MAKYSNAITIISGDNEQIEVNKHLLCFLSPILSSLFSTLCCTSPTIYLPDCSASSIIHFLQIITTGSTTADNVTVDINTVHINTVKINTVHINAVQINTSHNNAVQINSVDIITVQVTILCINTF